MDIERELVKEENIDEYIGIKPEHIAGINLDLYYAAADALISYRAFAQKRLREKVISFVMYDYEIDTARNFLWSLPMVAYHLRHGQPSLVNKWYESYPANHPCWKYVYPFFLKTRGFDVELPQ